MLNQETLDAIETGETIINVDNTRPAIGDNFKLPPFLRSLAETRLAAAKATNTAASHAAG